MSRSQASKFYGVTKQWTSFNHGKTIKAWGNQTWSEMWPGCPLPAWRRDISSTPPILSSVSERRCVCKWHIQINLFDKWKVVWDMSGHRDGYVGAAFISHVSFSWDHARWIRGGHWHRQQMTTKSPLAEELSQTDYGTATGSEMIRLTNVTNVITIHSCDLLIPRIGIW